MQWNNNSKLLSKQRLSWIKELNHYLRLNQTYTFYFEFFHDGMQGHSVDFKFYMCWVILKKIFAPFSPPPSPTVRRRFNVTLQSWVYTQSQILQFQAVKMPAWPWVQGRKGIYSMFKAPRFREFRFSYFWVTRCNKRGGAT